MSMKIGIEKYLYCVPNTNAAEYMHKNSISPVEVTVGRSYITETSGWKQQFVKEEEHDDNGAPYHREKSSDRGMGYVLYDTEAAAQARKDLDDLHDKVNCMRPADLVRRMNLTQLRVLYALLKSVAEKASSPSIPSGLESSTEDMEKERLNKTIALYMEECEQRGADKRSLQAELEATKVELEETQDELAAAIEDIKKPSVCECCERGCQGDEVCIDNGYMNFSRRKRAKRG